MLRLFQMGSFLYNWNVLLHGQNKHLVSLISGKRVNSAADDAAGMGISVRLSSYIRGNEAAKRNILDSMSLLQVAEGGLEGIQNILHRMRELTLHSMNGSLSQTEKDALAIEFRQMIDNLDLIAKTTNFNGIPLLSSMKNTGNNPGSEPDFKSTNPAAIKPVTLYSNTDWMHQIDVFQLAQGLHVGSVRSYNNADTALNLSGKFSVNGTVFSIDPTYSLQSIADLINSRNIGVAASLKFNGSGYELELKSKSTGASAVFDAVDLTSNAVTFDSSNPSVVLANSLIANTNWSKTVKVNSLAQAMVVAGNKYFADPNASLNISGDFRLNGKTFTITDSQSLQDIADMINAGNAGVTASISSVGSGYQLLMTSQTMGAAGAISLQDLSNGGNTFQTSDPGVVQTGILLSNTDWTYQVNVNQIAKAMQVGSATIADPAASLNLSGSFKINGTTFNVSGNHSLQDIANMINSANIGVNAVIAASGSGYELLITSQTTGLAGAITAQDLTVNTATFASSDPTKVQTGTLLSNTEWSDEVTVNSLAQTMQVGSGIVADPASSLGQSGTFSINGTQFTVNANHSLQDLASMINNGNVGVTATIVQKGSGYELLLTSQTSGVAGVFDVQDLTSDSNLFAVADPDVAAPGNLLSNTNWVDTLQVDQIAQELQVRSAAVTDPSASLNQYGQFRIDNVVFTVTENQSLQDIADMVNAANIGVTASIVSNGSAYELQLTSQTTGTAGAFTVVDLTANSSKLESTDPNVAQTQNLLSDTNWSDEVVVTQLAQTMEVGSAAFSNPAAALGQSGQFTLNGKTFTVTDNMSLQDIADLINAGGAGVTATVVNNGASYELRLISQTSGAAGAFAASDLTASDNTFQASPDNGVVQLGTLLSNTDWSDQLNVIQIAQAQKVGSNIQASATTALGYNGTFAINGVQFTVTDNMSLSDIANLINGNSSAGVTASVVQNGSGYQLLLTSKTTGSASAFTVDDISQNGKSLQSTNPNVVEAVSAIKNGNWSVDVDVKQLATTDQWTSYGYIKNWSLGFVGADGSYTLNGKNLTIAFNDTMLTVRDKINNGNYGVTASILSDQQGDHLVLTSNTSGAAGRITMDNRLDNFFTNNVAGQDASIEVTDGGTKYTLTYSTNSNVILTDRKGKDLAVINLKSPGKATVRNDKANSAVMENLGIIDSNNAFVNVIQNAQDAAYTIDGGSVQYSGTNTITLNDGTGDHATVTLLKAGATTVSNDVHGPVLQNLGILNSTGDYSKVIKTAQDAMYTVDGAAYTSSTNQVTLSDGGVNHATIALMGPGTTIVRNTKTSSIMQNIGVIDSSGQYSNVLKAAQDAMYKVNGIAYTSGTNTVTLRDNGVDHATVTLKKQGLTQVSNTVTNSVMKNIGVLSQSGQYSNLYSSAQDASYTVDGTAYTSSSNVVTLSEGGINHATVTLVGLGTSIVSNKLTHSVLQNLGVLNASGQFADVKQAAQDAIYSVNNVSYTSGSNNVTLGENGVDYATVILTGAGTAIVSNDRYSGTMAELGILTGGGQFANVVKAAQDASYTVDGITYTSNTNSVTLTDTDGTQLANITLVNKGTSVVSNAVTFAILQELGVLNGSGQYAKIIQNAQDAIYTVDGQFHSNPNNLIDLVENGILLAKVELLKAESSIVSNTNSQSGGGSPVASPVELIIQSGSGASHKHRILLANLTAQALGLDNLSITDADVLEKLDLAFEKVLGERAKFGAVYNALQHRYETLSEETLNLQATNSRIVDSDMAKEIIGFLQKKLLLTNLRNLISKQLEFDRNHIIQLLDPGVPVKQSFPKAMEFQRAAQGERHAGLSSFTLP